MSGEMAEVLLNDSRTDRHEDTPDSYRILVHLIAESAVLMPISVFGATMSSCGSEAEL